MAGANGPERRCNAAFFLRYFFVISNFWMGMANSSYLFSLYLYFGIVNLDFTWWYELISPSFFI